MCDHSSVGRSKRYNNEAKEVSIDETERIELLKEEKT
jgi:hypothetical protein